MSTRKQTWIFTIFAVSLTAKVVASPNGLETEEDDWEFVAAQHNCICVPVYQCDDNGVIITDGTGLIGPRRKSEYEDDGELFVEEGEPSPCGPFHVCCKDPDGEEVLPYVHRCGTRNIIDIKGRILTDQGEGFAEFGEWPWMAAILKKEDGKYAYKHGGTLIDERHVITVAHWAEKFNNDIDNIAVRLGGLDIESSTAFLPHEDFSISEIMIHPNYNSRNLTNDIAILRLSHDVEFKPHIDSVCLPNGEDEFSGQDCTVTGWGTKAYKSGKYSVVMKEITVPVLKNSKCQRLLRKTRLGRFFKLDSGFLCAGGEKGKDSCKGDGGGPLVCYREDNSYTVAGLVSWGIDCGQPDVPGVYVNVQKYINWITSETGKPITYYWNS